MLIKGINELVKVDICIIGTGIAGGTLINKLAQKGKNFLVLEAGDLNGNSDNVTYENIGREFGIRSTTSIQLGGTSNLWHGVLSPLDAIDFEKRDWVENSGWPIKLDDLMPYYKEAAKALKVEDFDFFDTDKLSNELKDKLDDMRFNRNILRNKMFQQPLPETNFKQGILDIVENSQSHHLLLNSPALKFEINNNGKVQWVIIGNNDGTTSKIEADTFIVAAGALESPRLLLNSVINNKNIGKYLMDHPMGNLCQVQFKHEQKAHIYSAMKYKAHIAIKTGLELVESLQEKMKFLNHTFYMRPSFKKGVNNETEKIKLSLLAFKDGGLTFKDVWRVLTNLNVIYQIVTYKLSLDTTYKYADLFFVTEQIPSVNSNVMLSNKKDKWGYPISKVNWQVDKKDLEVMDEWYNLLKNEALGDDDYIFTHEFKDINWNKNFTSAAHHVGTCRMGHDENEGVVDKNLKVFGVDNLYVCDGSIFTTAGNVNNGLTISAFACRLAEHLGNDK